MDDSIKQSLEQFGIELPNVPSTNFGNTINNQSIVDINEAEKKLMDSISSIYGNKMDNANNIDTIDSAMSSIFEMFNSNMTNGKK